MPLRRSPLSGRSRARTADVTISLRTAIGLAFTLILLLSSGALVWLNGEASARLLRKQVDQQFDILISGVTSQVALQLDGADAVLNTLSVDPPPPSDPETQGRLLVRVLANLVATSPSVQSLVTASADGRYVIARRVIGMPPQAGDGDVARPAAYVVQIGGPDPAARDRYVFLDATFHTTTAAMPAAVPAATGMDARRRPWYRMAVATERAVATPAYRFKDDNGFGFTLSRRAQDDADLVFGADVSLAALSGALKRGLVFDGERVVVFTPDGALVGDSAGPAPSASGVSASPKLDDAILAAYRRDPSGHSVELQAADGPVYAELAPLAINGAQLVIASTVPVAVFEAPVTRLLVWSLVIQAAIVGVAFVLVHAASRSISHPIHALAADVEAIIRFRTPERMARHSHIREIRRLLGAVDTLALTLRSFSTYLPAPFVRGIVDRGEIPTVGGKRETVIVMFSDIDGFTRISETLPPDEILPQLSRYFGEISDEIRLSEGTLDKFMGDGVMAFWTLPADVPDRAAEVCRAVLRAGRRIDALNVTFAAEGRPVLPTRFGLHAGEAMVGSVGTAHRLNYTVLGHAVNVASRVEQLNKRFGTRVLVTAAVRDAAGDAALFRHLGEAEVRGATGSVHIFELVADAADRPAPAR
jgi:adenylate cyclase